MKNLMFFGLSLVLSTSAIAQPSANIEIDASDIARQIQSEGRYLSPAERSEIAVNLASIKAILQGQSGGGYGAQYTCVSRDNDGRNPYVIGIKEGIRVTRLKEELFTTEQLCVEALSSTRTMGRFTLMCVSKDNDGRNPYQLGILDPAGLVRIQRTVTANTQECQSTLNKLRPNRRGVALCTSRDNDGRSPYIAVNINLSNGSVDVGSESFTDMSSCESFLNN